MEFFFLPCLVAPEDIGLFVMLEEKMVLSDVDVTW
jgi:hypothetical protein